jgi:hypothetical protein
MIVLAVIIANVRLANGKSLIIVWLMNGWEMSRTPAQPTANSRDMVKLRTSSSIRVINSPSDSQKPHLKGPAHAQTLVPQVDAL